MPKIMKFNRIMAIVFGLLFGVGSLWWIWDSILTGRHVDFSAAVVVLASFLAVFWGISEFRKKKMIPLGKENK